MSDSQLVWFKSSHSDDQGGNCLEVAYSWRKSSHSTNFDNACVEVAACPHVTHVRDSKLGAQGPEFAVAAHAWAAFVGHARSL